MDSISDTLRALRAARALVNLSQEQVAERAGVSRRTVVRIESGGKGIALDAVEKLRLAFEREGVEFLPSTPERGPGVALRRQKLL
ncbi:helix-turn-helix transcriptional regulator [Mesorhizobium sp. B2-4-14]|uniref:helix-turn-helix domain-containing protein n=1 Tax=Mesorhizobium sp. B2-4-14 TaxID=2589935 RepID=UPI001127DC79|nr:helix-turn-helix transcriptional regulator [Mesorhizobium sp. B2-4-14]TPL00719.1 helix-turn-helix transcriptional regulator [Mesorhizobium sp. B2-4-14]